MPAAASKPIKDDQQIVEGKVWAVLAYLSIFCILPLIFQKNNSYVLFHGRQGIVLFVAEATIFILHILLGTWILRLGMFLCGVCSLIGIMGTLKGQHYKIPFIADIAEKISL